MADIFKDKIFICAICIKKKNKTKIASFNSHLHKGNNLFCYETNIRSMITFICGGKNVKLANVFIVIVKVGQGIVRDGEGAEPIHFNLHAWSAVRDERGDFTILGLLLGGWLRREGEGVLL